MKSALNWRRDGQHWPHAEHSRFIQAGGLRWHVQRMGRGLPVLLLHGTGASTHSWRGVLPLLANQVEVFAPDLPGHAFTERPAGRGMSLSGMAQAVQSLLNETGFAPRVIIGHSAGAAIAAQMLLQAPGATRHLVSLNGAFMPFEGLAGHIFPTLAKLLFLNPIVPRTLSWGGADTERVIHLLRSTGSEIDPEGVALYSQLLRSPAHVGAVLAMLARWNLEDLWRDLPQLQCALTLVVGMQDKAVPPQQAYSLAARCPQAEVVEMPGLGHLAHEESPSLVIDRLRPALQELEVA
nr:alpha/beta fold hydrolase [Oceanococcus sp. HetDA_MAG_MS8]